MYPSKPQAYLFFSIIFLIIMHMAVLFNDHGAFVPSVILVSFVDFLVLREIFRVRSREEIRLFFNPDSPYDQYLPNMVLLSCYLSVSSVNAYVCGLVMDYLISPVWIWVVFCFFFSFFLLMTLMLFKHFFRMEKVFKAETCFVDGSARPCSADLGVAMLRLACLSNVVFVYTYSNQQYRCHIRFVRGVNRFDADLLKFWTQNGRDMVLSVNDRQIIVPNVF